MFKIGSFITKVLSGGAYPPRPWRFRIATILLLLAMLWPVSQYLRVVLRNPQRTGLLVIGTSYSAPWDINPWCEENMGAFEKLDKHNLSLRRVSDPALLACGQWAELEDDVAHLVEGTPRGQPLIVYINLHGVVAIDGRPYLLVRDSKPLDCSTWLPLDRLVDRIQQSLPHPRPVIVAIEGGRQHSLPFPAAGQSNFADAVRKWYASLKSSGQSAGLAILVGSSSRFGSVEHAGIAGDLFSSCLAEALCGECDQPVNGGNGNQQVEWSELQRYVHDQVEHRSRRLRVVPQLTEHFVGETVPSFVAWNTSVDSRTLFSVDSSAAEIGQVETLTNSWKRIYALQAMRPWHEDPHAWGLLKRTMVGWEQAIFGGSAGRSRLSEFEQEARRLVQHLETTINQRAQTASLESQLARRAAELWQQLSRSPSLDTARQLVDADANLTSANTLPALPMLAQLIEQPELRIWSRPDLLERFSGLQARIEKVRSEQFDTPRLRELLALESAMDLQRRQLEDAISINAIDETWLTMFMELATRLDRWQHKCTQVQQAIQFNEQMLARLPTICQAVDMLDASQLAAHGAGESLSERLDTLEQTLAVNRQRLNAAFVQDVPIDELLVANEIANELFTSIVQRWQRMLFDASGQVATHVMPLETILASTLLPIEVGSIDKAVQLRLTTHKRLAQIPASTSQSDSAVAEVATDFGVHNQNRLMRWLNWPDSAQGVDSLTREDSDPTWMATHTARMRACFAMDERLTQTIGVWQKMHTRLRTIEASRRVLDDFWKSPQVAGQDYYAAVARSLTSSAAEHDRLELDNLLMLRSAAARDGLQVDCECRPVWNEREPRVTACRIQQIRPGMPEGQAAVQLVEAAASTSTVGLCSPQGISIGSVGSSQTLHMPIESPGAMSAKVQAAVKVTFRGHQYSSKLELHPHVSHATSGVTATAGPATITLLSTARRQRARMLVLDCSASMHQPQAAEGAFDAASPPQSPSRLDTARLALDRILNHWRGSQDHVGVILYGHRVALGTREQGKLLQMRYMGRYPFAREIEAYEDVETILPPGRFDDQEYSAVMERLQHVVPWGQTPLYLSVAQAIQELTRYQSFQEGGSNSQRDMDIIVVSDGRNYQFNPTSDKDISLRQVIQQAKNAGIHVHIIGFGIAAGELEQATSEFTQLAQQTGGSVSMQVQTAMQLVEQIDSLTEAEVFRARLPNGQWVDRRCGETLELPVLEAANTPITVDYQRTTTTVPVNPRSAVRLAPGVSRLVRAQPAFQSPFRTKIATPLGQASPFEVIVNTPMLKSGRAEWQLSLEHREQIVVERPKYLWLELTAHGSSPASELISYVVCDPVWQAETTQPVLSFETADWPEEASGSLQFWYGDQLPMPLVRFNCVPATLPDNWQTSERREDSGQVQYQLQADSDGVTLLLWHGQSTEVLELMPLIDNLPDQTRIDRRYEPQQRLSIHRFIHPELTSRHRLDVAIYSVSAFKSQSLRSTAPIEVRLQKEVASLPVSIR